MQENRIYMTDLTLSFQLICFSDIKAATLSTASIPRDQLHRRMLVGRTSKGNYVKMFVLSGPDMRIGQLVVYNPTGCIIKTATELLIHANKQFNLDTAAETTTDADLLWQMPASGDGFLVLKGGTSLYAYPDYDTANISALKAAVYQSGKIAGSWLNYQLIFCRTTAGNYARLLCSSGTNLTLINMSVYNSNGTLVTHKNSLALTPGSSIDLDTGNLTTSNRDLWWHGPVAGEYILETCGSAALSFSSYFSLQKYHALLALPAIKNALVITGSTNRDYDSWTMAEKYLLREFIYLLQTNRSLPISGPPELTADNYMSNCDALKIYLAHAAHSLWVDANNKVGWLLSGAGADHLTYLFDMRKLLAYSATYGYYFSGEVMGDVTDWSPMISYNFLQSNGFIKADKWETIKALASWSRANLLHMEGPEYDGNGPFATEQDQLQYYFNYRGMPPVDKMISPTGNGKHLTTGCWGTDGFLAAVLRSVNIPVKHGRSVFGTAVHSRAEFFTEGKNLLHGDDLYNAWIRLGINNVPIEKIFVDDSSMHSLVDAPSPLPGKTAGETSGYNHTKRLIALAITYKTNYLLWLRCLDISTGASLQNSKLWKELHDYYSDAEISATITVCNNAIAAIPGGCPVIYNT